MQIDHNTNGIISTGNPRSAGYKIVGAIRNHMRWMVTTHATKVVDIDVTVENTLFKKRHETSRKRKNRSMGNRFWKRKKNNLANLKTMMKEKKYVDYKVREEEIRVLEFKEALAETTPYTRLMSCVACTERILHLSSI